MEEVCPEGITQTLVTEALDTAEQHLSAGTIDEARIHLSQAHKHLLCINAIAPSPMMGRLSRQFALAFFLDQDGDEAIRWLRSAHLADPDGPWPAGVGPDHPIQGLTEELDWFVAGPKETGFLTAKKTTYFVNGQFAPQPSAPVETPLLFQRANKKGVVDKAWWQDGAAFPSEHLLAGAGPTPAPRWWTGPSTGAVATASAVPVETPPPVVASADPVEPDVTPETDDTSEAVVEAPPPPPPAPVEPSEDDEELVVLPTHITVDTYVDPFEAAKTRRVLRERSERTIQDASGSTAIVRTEIVSFVPDPSEGRPVTHQHFEQWLTDTPDWHRAAAIARGDANADYLTDWQGTRHPPGARTKPMVWVSFSAARAYCQSFENDLASASFQSADALDWEWRVENDSAARVSKAGKHKKVSQPQTSFDDVGFRCRR